jgi:NADH dehydrogenase FAD-containing subunit
MNARQRTAEGAVVTDEERCIGCDTVVIATGVVPGKALAQSAGIKVGRGIRVNAHMETNLPGIYACGDYVETVDACTGEDAMFQLKHNALEQARVVARNLLGERTAYPGGVGLSPGRISSTPTPPPSARPAAPRSANWDGSRSSSATRAPTTCGSSSRTDWWPAGRPSENLPIGSGSL